jgi:hypothetical protein
MRENCIATICKTGMQVCMAQMLLLDGMLLVTEAFLIRKIFGGFEAVSHEINHQKSTCNAEMHEYQRRLSVRTFIAENYSHEFGEPMEFVSSKKFPLVETFRQLPFAQAVSISGNEPEPSQTQILLNTRVEDTSNCLGTVGAPN